MLAISKLTDLLSGKLSDQNAYEYLLGISQEKLSATLINEIVTNIIQVNNSPSLELFRKQGDIIDCCGTGGSGIGRYNISTSAAFVLAAGGLAVAKFGNRASTGSSGSFDFLEHLGFSIISDQSILSELLQETGLCFLFAPQFYPSLAKLAPVRKAIGKATIFNLIGPLLNPAKPPFRVLGTTNSDRQKAIADYLFTYKVGKKALVVRADSGLDELDPASNNEILTVDDLAISKSSFHKPMDNRGLTTREKDSLCPTMGAVRTEEPSPSTAQAITPAENSHLFKEMISGKLSSSNYFQACVTLNAGAGFFVAGKSSSIEEGQKLAENLLSSGAVLAKYEQSRSNYAKYTQ